MSAHADLRRQKGIGYLQGAVVVRKENQTPIGFDHCVRVGVSDEQIVFLSEADATILGSLKGLRDAAQDYLLSPSEHHLYTQLQAGVILYRDLLKKVFDRDLATELPDRVLPIFYHSPH